MLVYKSFTEIKAKALFSTFSFVMGNTDSRAFHERDTVILTVKIPSVLCATNAILSLYTDANMSEREFEADLDNPVDPAYDLFNYGFRPRVGLYYYVFGVDTVYGRLWVNRDGTFTPDKNAATRTQLMVYDEYFKTPERFRGSMMYQIFPDRFARSGKVHVRRKINRDWENGVPQYAEVPGGDVANNVFFGGDLWGIADRLDYIKSLGVDTLYLCPIFEAASNHRYDTCDYKKVDKLLGGDEALQYLIAELKKRDMKLILDGVFNHTGDDSRYFNKYGHYKPVMGAYNSPESRYAKWYTFNKYPDDYRCWWGVKVLPEVRTDEPTFRRFICGGRRGVIDHYMKLGVDGWRLDVADELSDNLLYDLRERVKTDSPDALIIGEVWEDASNKVAYNKRRHYFEGNQLDSVMNYPLKDAIIDFILTRDKTKLESVAMEIYLNYPPVVRDVLMNILGTHDTERILSVLADVGIDKKSNDELATFRLPEQNRVEAVKRLKLAWALLCAFPGIPCVYYGDEAGMEGGRDPFNRMPFVPERADTELTEFYRRVGAARTQREAFAGHELSFIETFRKDQLMILRGDVLIAANLSDEDWEIEFDAPPRRLLDDSWLMDNGCMQTVPPMSVEYFVICCDITQKRP